MYNGGASKEVVTMDRGAREPWDSMSAANGLLDVISRDKTQPTTCPECGTDAYPTGQCVWACPKCGARELRGGMQRKVAEELVGRGAICAPPF